MPDDKKEPLQGLRKWSVGVVLILFGMYLVIKGQTETGLGLIATGAGIVVGGNLYDKKNSKNSQN